MVDPEPGRPAQHRLAPVSDAESGGAHHVQIVGAVAYRRGRHHGEPVALGQLGQGRQL